MQLARRRRLPRTARSRDAVSSSSSRVARQEIAGLRIDRSRGPGARRERSSKRHDHDRRKHREAAASSAVGPQPHRADGREPEAEDQAAHDRHAVEQHVVQLSNTGRHQPLQGLVANADCERRERRKYQRREVTALVPRPVIQPRERTVLDEMKPLDDIDVRIACSRGPRVERPSTDGDGQQAVSRRALLSDRRSAETTAMATATTTMPPMMSRYCPGSASWIAPRI
jgi:hypothetical protein